jgi:hypothetical protein
VEKGQYSQTSPSFKRFSKTVSVTKMEKHLILISLQYKIFIKKKILLDFWEDKLGVNFQSDMNFGKLLIRKKF